MNNPNDWIKCSITEPMNNQNDWIKCSITEAIGYWTKGHDVRCEIREDELIYTRSKGDYDVMEDKCGASPCRMELAAGVWSYKP